MEHFAFTPQLVADVLIVVFFVAGTVRRQRRWPPPQQTRRGTTLVFGGCYAVTLIALNFSLPAPSVAPPVGWIGVLAAAGGLARIVATIAALPPDGLPRRDVRRYPDSLGNLAFWIGASAASLNLIAMLTVAVAMLAATGVRLSLETPPTGRSSSGALRGSEQR